MALSRLAEAARSGGATHILLAGDTFDAETPSPQTRRQALSAMASHADLTWVILPGNHDSLAASELWRRLAAEAPANVQLMLEATASPLIPGVTLLSAPCTQRRPGRDLTDFMSQAASPEGDIRLGLAHGPVSGFDGEEQPGGIIAPDRAEQAGLDYLALGDWHGQLRIGPRTWYPGTPERDGFKHDGRGSALLVEIAGAGAPPAVTPVETGQFRWTTIETDGADLGDVLPAQGTRRDTLLRLRLAGQLSLPDRAALLDRCADVAPDFGWCDVDDSRLQLTADTSDLDLIDTGGALRSAAAELLAEAQDITAPDETRATAQAALARLFVMAGNAR